MNIKNNEHGISSGSERVTEEHHCRRHAPYTSLPSTSIFLLHRELHLQKGLCFRSLVSCRFSCLPNALLSFSQLRALDDERSGQIRVEGFEEVGVLTRALRALSLDLDFGMDLDDFNLTDRVFNMLKGQEQAM